MGRSHTLDDSSHPTRQDDNRLDRPSEVQRKLQSVERARVAHRKRDAVLIPPRKLQHVGGRSMTGGLSNLVRDRRRYTGIARAIRQLSGTQALTRLFQPFEKSRPRRGFPVTGRRCRWRLRFPCSLERSRGSPICIRGSWWRQSARFSYFQMDRIVA